MDAGLRDVSHCTPKPIEAPLRLRVSLNIVAFWKFGHFICMAKGPSIMRHHRVLPFPPIEQKGGFHGETTTMDATLGPTSSQCGPFGPSGLPIGILPEVVLHITFTNDSYTNGFQDTE